MNFSSYISGYVNGELHYPDHFFRNGVSGFTDVMTGLIQQHDADHGVQWADFDQDGDLDLSLADFQAQGGHHVFRNTLTGEASRRSIQVLVLDEKGHYTRAGSEVRVYRADTRNLLGSGIVDTGSGSCSQNAAPVHVGLGSVQFVDVEVTIMTTSGREVTYVKGIDPSSAPIPIEVRVNRN